LVTGLQKESFDSLFTNEDFLNDVYIIKRKESDISVDLRLYVSVFSHVTGLNLTADYVIQNRHRLPVSKPHLKDLFCHNLSELTGMNFSHSKNRKVEKSFLNEIKQFISKNNCAFSDPKPKELVTEKMMTVKHTDKAAVNFMNNQLADCQPYEAEIVTLAEPPAVKPVFYSKIEQIKKKPKYKQYDSKTTVIWEKSLNLGENELTDSAQFEYVDGANKRTVVSIVYSVITKKYSFNDFQFSTWAEVLSAFKQLFTELTKMTSKKAVVMEKLRRNLILADYEQDLQRVRKPPGVVRQMVDPNKLLRETMTERYNKSEIRREMLTLVSGKIDAKTFYEVVRPTIYWEHYLFRTHEDNVKVRRDNILTQTFCEQQGTIFRNGNRRLYGRMHRKLKWFRKRLPASLEQQENVLKLDN